MFTMDEEDEVNGSDDNRKSPLFIACQNGDYELMKCPIERGNFDVILTLIRRK